MKKYKLRSECISDVMKFLLKCQPSSVINIELIPDPILPDCEVIFESNNTIYYFLDVLSDIEDGHVMLQTLDVYSEYTGERKYDRI